MAVIVPSLKVIFQYAIFRNAGGHGGLDVSNFIYLIAWALVGDPKSSGSAR
jgi:hypothetical protein